MDALKIDKSFLSGIESSAAALVLIQSLVSLAHSLGMRVVVEGVETPEQLELVSAAGCDELQGYLLGRPSAELLGFNRANPTKIFAAIGTSLGESPAISR